jgi:hypothetical protein
LNTANDQRTSRTPPFRALNDQRHLEVFIFEQSGMQPQMLFACLDILQIEAYSNQ